MMDRRAFLRGLAAAVAAKLPLPVFPAPPSPASAPDGLLRGELGVWEGIRIHLANPAGMAPLTAAELLEAREWAERSTTHSITWLDEDVYFVHIPPDYSLRGDE